jgi:hypothetical protein
MNEFLTLKEKEPVYVPHKLVRIVTLHLPIQYIYVLHMILRINGNFPEQCYLIGIVNGGGVCLL